MTPFGTLFRLYPPDTIFPIAISGAADTGPRSSSTSREAWWPWVEVAEKGMSDSVMEKCCSDRMLRYTNGTSLYERTFPRVEHPKSTLEFTSSQKEIAMPKVPGQNWQEG
ncbi:hypothetical protein G7K_3286-t1 [Saitoella complicata NRRL Y-17804]|uniref:Uncharacterized protein n=1 Tax=Saitoella complicata (strain BCRC 22490 / CBS 7301 / JCM 7358 / NBRC 10748 / NRRL Y-17804) TaxID=698492 RepID=A0A0E9NH42_SAICN|nr:hypothetical protein G7K_3286-t1 [Saitoella complicata NRRL Y-17804]